MSGPGIEKARLTETGLQIRLAPDVYMNAYAGNSSPTSASN